MPEWIWAVVCALGFAASVPLAVLAQRRSVPHATLILALFALGYLLLAALFAADALVQRWSDPTLRFTRGCVAGLGVGAVLGALGLLATRAVRCRHLR
jgi:hypothetical protein